MLEQWEQELVSAAIDGELSPDEQRAHDELLAASAEARALRAELLAVAALVGSLPEQVPPPGLAERVLDRAAPPRVTVLPLRRGWRRAQLPLAFAAGLLVALAVPRWLPLHTAPGDEAAMSGTLAPSAQFAADVRRIDVEGLSGRVALGRRGDTRSLDFDLRADGPLEIEIGLAGSGRSFGGLVVDGADGGLEEGNIAVTGGTVRVVGDGATAFGLLLPATADRARGEMTVAIRSGGVVRYRASFGG